MGKLVIAAIMAMMISVEAGASANLKKPPANQSPPLKEMALLLLWD